MIYAIRYLTILEEKEKLIIVSRDKIFNTFTKELNNNQVNLVQTIGDIEHIIE